MLARRAALDEVGVGEQAVAKGDLFDDIRIVARAAEPLVDDVDEADVVGAVEPGVNEIRPVDVEDHVSSGPWLSMLLFHAPILTRGCYTACELGLCRPDDDAAVVAAEAEAVGDRRRRLPRPGFAEHDVDRELWIDRRGARGRRNQAMLDRQQQRNGFQRAGGAEGVTGDALRRGDRHTALARRSR